MPTTNNWQNNSPNFTGYNPLSIVSRVLTNKPTKFGVTGRTAKASKVLTKKYLSVYLSIYQASRTKQSNSGHEVGDDFPHSAMTRWQLLPLHFLILATWARAYLEGALQHFLGGITTKTAGTLGPNSQHLRPEQRLFSFRSSKVRGEGWVGTVTSPEGSFSSLADRMASPKFDGIGHEVSHGTKKLQPFSKITKRSYKRFLHKLQVRGLATYHGTVHMRAPTASASCAPAGRSWTMTSRKKRARASVLNWNCGTSHSESYAELLRWVSFFGFDIILIQGTHWSAEEAWQTHARIYGDIRLFPLRMWPQGGWPFALSQAFVLT